jgi:hypothetical protein
MPLPRTPWPATLESARCCDYPGPHKPTRPGPATACGRRAGSCACGAARHDGCLRAAPDRALHEDARGAHVRVLAELPRGGADPHLGLQPTPTQQRCAADRCSCTRGVELKYLTAFCGTLPGTQGALYGLQCRSATRCRLPGNQQSNPKRRRRGATRAAACARSVASRGVAAGAAEPGFRHAARVLGGR